MLIIKLFVKDNCQQCLMTERWLVEHQIKFKTINLTENPNWAESLKKRGFQSTPVVYTGTQVWTGFRPQKLNQLNTEHAR